MMAEESSNTYNPSGALLHLASHFQSRSLTADHLERMHPAVRSHYAKMAGLNEPSEEGWNTLIDHMRRSSSTFG
jgi:hypothetical protein